VATLPPAARDAFRADLRIAQAASRSAVVPKRARSRDHSWDLWQDFCLELSVDPLLNTVEDPIHYFMVFAVRYRDGRLAKDGEPIRSRTVEDILRAIGQTMASLGSKDHRLISHRTIEYRLSQQLKAWKNVDPPPTRVKPLPFCIVQHAITDARHSTIPFAMAVADMLAIGFFFLCRPGEHTLSDEDSKSVPFRLCDVVFYQGSRRLLDDTPFDQLHSATFVNLTYSDQKGGVRGETIGHGRTRHAIIGPVKCLARRVQHLRMHHAPSLTPLHTVYTNSGVLHVRSIDLTRTIRQSAQALFPITGIDPRELSSRSTRPGGAMALLCARVDSDIIRLVGRWRSDEMFRYLHAQAYPLMHTFAQQMITHGSFTLAPGQHVPASVTPLLNQVPL